MPEHWASVTRHQFYVFLRVQTLFTVLDDLEANQDVYYAAICDSGKDRYHVKPAVRTPIFSSNFSNENVTDLLRWVAFNNDWPFYIERLKIRRRRGQVRGQVRGQGRRLEDQVFLDGVLLRSRPLSWCNVYVTQSARHFYTAFNDARASYKKEHKGVTPTSRLLVNIIDGTYSWVPDDAEGTGLSFNIV